MDIKEVSPPDRQIKLIFPRIAFVEDKAIIENDIMLIGIKEINELIPESAIVLCFTGCRGSSK